MKKKALIYTIIIAIGIIGVAGLLILGSASDRSNDTSDPASTSSVEVNVQIPPVSSTIDILPVTDDSIAHVDPETTFDPSDPVGNGDIASDEVQDADSKVMVVDGTSDENAKEIPATTVPIDDDTVKTGQKEKNEEMPADLKNEILNNNEIGKKEEAEEKRREEEDTNDKPTIVEDEESTISDGTEKPVIIVDDTEERPAEDDANENGNAPVFVNPAQGGENPFEGSEDSEVDDHGSDEFIDDDGDKPGEGIHF